MLLQAGDDARRRQCLSRTRGECVAALANFLPALRKRLFLAVDVTGPVSRKPCERRHRRMYVSVYVVCLYVWMCGCIVGMESTCM